MELISCSLSTICLGEISLFESILCICCVVSGPVVFQASGTTLQGRFGYLTIVSTGFV